MEQIKTMFSSQIIDLRKQQNLTQEQVSERLESGNSLPDFLHTLALVYFLGFDFNSFAKEVFSDDYIQTAKR